MSKVLGGLLNFCNGFLTGGDIGETALHIAARIEEARGEKCTKMLLKSGADTNLAMTDGRTPLHIAAECGTLAVMKLLLAHDADPLKDDLVSRLTTRLPSLFITLKKEKKSFL